MAIINLDNQGVNQQITNANIEIDLSSLAQTIIITANGNTTNLEISNVLDLQEKSILIYSQTLAGYVAPATRVSQLFLLQNTNNSGYSLNIVGDANNTYTTGDNAILLASNGSSNGITAGSGTYKGTTTFNANILGSMNSIFDDGSGNAKFSGDITGFGFSTDASGTSSTISVTASPFTYQNNSNSNQFVVIIGGTISAITLKGTSINITASTFVLRNLGQDALVITYSVAPTMFCYQL